MKVDIKHRNDIILLLDRFYQEALFDETLKPIFTKIIGDNIQDHMPIMYNFWSSILIREQSYTGNVMLKHIAIHKQMPLDKEHFEQWIHLWDKTVNELFKGPVADEAKKRASLMKELMLFKIGKSSEQGFIQ